MDEDRDKSVRAKLSGEVDRLSNLPESLLCHVLLNLPTKDVVKCSVLSSRWRNLWKHVPGLNLEIGHFRDHDLFVSFVDGFLLFNSDSSLQSFKIKYNSDGAEEPEIGLINRWINTVVDRKVKHLVVVDNSERSWDFQILPTIYTCESLVFLKLSGLTLASPKFVSLPSLKALDLIIVEFADNLGLETLISSCPVLESLFIRSFWVDKMEVFRVCSQSLLSFTYVSDSACDLVGATVVEIDAPRLKYMRLDDCPTASFILKNPSSLVNADIDTVFNFTFEKRFDPNDLPKRNMIRNFLGKISCVKQQIIASSTLEVIYDYSRCEQLPLFRNLSILRVEFYGYKWEMLPIFLESCPNLKTLVVGSAPCPCPDKEGISIISGPRHLLPSLEYVQMERPFKGEAMEMKLVSYLLESSANLKKLALRLDNSRKKEESAIFKELRAIPRLCSLCQVVVFS